MRLYKLTDEHSRTYDNTQWGENVTHAAKGRGNELCSDGVIHAYTSPILAVLCNPIHADFSDPVLWEAEGEIVASDGLKTGVKKLTTIRRIPLPSITPEQRVKFAILSALQVEQNQTFVAWAQTWLSGQDRSKTAAKEAAETAARAAEAAEAAAWAAGEAAWATEAARAAARAAWAAAWAAEAARAAAWAAARAAAWAARAAARAAAWAAAGTEIDFAELAEEAMK